MVHHPDYFRQGHLFVQDTTKKSKFPPPYIAMATSDMVSLLHVQLCSRRGTGTSVSSGRKKSVARK